MLTKNKLSKRQKVLLERLQTLVERIVKEPLPVVVEEVWGFGSFLRGKSDPRDIDLVVKFSKKSRMYELFVQLMNRAVKQSDHSLGKYLCPADALLDTIATFGDAEARLYESEFARWLNGITWNMIENAFVPEDAYGWDRLTRRLLQDGLPGIKVTSVVPVGADPLLAANKYHLLWSKSSPDLMTNLSQALEPRALQETRLVDLADMTQQFATMSAQIQTLTALFTALIKEQRSFKGREEIAAWYDLKIPQISFALDSNTVKSIIEHRFGDPQISNAMAISVADADNHKNLTDVELSTLVEKTRTSVKALLGELAVIRKALWNLEEWHTRRGGTTLPMSYSAGEFVALCVLRETPKYLIKEERIREQLQRLELPVDRISSIRREGSKTYYEISE